MTQMPVTAEHLRRLIPAFSLSMVRVDERCAPAQHYSEHFDDHSHALFASSGHVFAARTDDPAAFGNLLRNRGAAQRLPGADVAPKQRCASSRSDPKPAYCGKPCTRSAS